MAFTLSNCLAAMYRELGQMNVSTATGGSTTTFVDSKQVGLHRDDSWKDGCAFVLTDAGGAGAAPEGEFGRISAYADSTGTFTVDTALTVAVASGDTFGFCSSYYPLRQMMQAANDGLREIGDMPFVDTTTLDTISGDTEYTAAVAWKRAKPYRIDIQGSTADAQDNQWQRTDQWQWVPAGAGSTGLIIFDGYQTAGRGIRVWYRDSHPQLTAFSSVINERIHPDLAVKAAILKALAWQNARVSGADDYLLQLMNKAMQDFAQARIDHLPEKPRKRVKTLIVGRNTVDEDYFSYPDPV